MSDSLPAERSFRLSDRTFALFIAGMVLLAFGLRSYALLLLSKTPYVTYLTVDENFYYTWAASIAHGTQSVSSAYLSGPFPAYVMAAVYKIISPNVISTRILNIILGASTCFVIYLIGKSIADRTTGLIAGYVAAVYKPFIFYSIVPLKASLGVFLFAGSMYLFVKVLHCPSVLNAALLGLVTGLLLETRENSIAMVPIMIVMILWVLHRDGLSRKRITMSLAMVIAGLAFSVAPFVIRNYVMTDKFAVSTHQTGMITYLANNLDNPFPYYRPVAFATPSPFTQEIEFRIEASRRVGHELSAHESSVYWSRQVYRIAVQHPRAFLSKLGQKTLAFLNKSELDENYDLDFLSQSVPFFKLPFVGLSFIFPLGVAGMVMSAPTSWVRLCMMTLFATYAITLIVAFTNARYRLPLLVILIPFAVIGLKTLLFRLRTQEMNWIAFYAFLIGLGCIVENLPVPGADDKAGTYNAYAVMMNDLGFEGEAIRYWEQSSQMEKPFSVYADIALATKYIVRKELARALPYVFRIPEQSFAAANKYSLIGDIKLAQGYADEAISAYKRSLDINYGQLDTRAKLIRALEQIDKTRAAIEKKRAAYIASFYAGT